MPLYIIRGDVVVSAVMTIEADSVEDALAVADARGNPDLDGDSIVAPFLDDELLKFEFELPECAVHSCVAIHE
jgi:hypothetical protein